MDIDNFDYLSASDPEMSVHEKAGRLLGIMMGELENQRRTASFETWEHHAAERDRQILQLQKAVYQLACAAIQLGGKVATLEEKIRNCGHEPDATEATGMELPTTAERLLGLGMTRAAYINNGERLQLLDIVNNDAYATARDYIRNYDGRRKVMWHRDGSGSAHGEIHKVWWAEMPLPDGRVVGWFAVNPNFPDP